MKMLILSRIIFFIITHLSEFVSIKSIKNAKIRPQNLHHRLFCVILLR